MAEIDKVEKEVHAILEKNNMKYGYEFHFPKYRILPSEVKLAMKVLQNHGLKILLVLKEKQ